MGNTNWKNSPRCQFGHEQSEETRKKIGIKAEGRMTGFKHTEEFKKQTSDRMMGNTYGKNSPGFSGHSHTEDAKDRISKSLVGQMAGEDNPGYIHGQAMVGYAGTGFYMIKYRIRERDGHTCQICFKTRIEEGKELAVHHTDYDKSNADDSNLVTLCNRCHSKTNPKPERQAYTQMFQFRALFLLIHPVSDLNSLAA